MSKLVEIPKYRNTYCPKCRLLLVHKETWCPKEYLCYGADCSKSVWRDGVEGIYISDTICPKCGLTYSIAGEPLFDKSLIPLTDEDIQGVEVGHDRTPEMVVEIPKIPCSSCEWDADVVICDSLASPKCWKHYREHKERMKRDYGYDTDCVPLVVWVTTICPRNKEHPPHSGCWYWRNGESW